MTDAQVFFLKWAIPGLFLFIFVFSTQLTVNKCSIKVCRCLDSNHGSLVSKATTLPLSHTTVLLLLQKHNQHYIGPSIAFLAEKLIQIFSEPDTSSGEHPWPDPGGFGRRAVRRARHRNRGLPLEPQRQVLVVRLRVPDQEQLLQAGKTAAVGFLNIGHPSVQSYKHSTIVIYKSRVVLPWKLPRVHH